MEGFSQRRRGRPGVRHHAAAAAAAVAARGRVRFASLLLLLRQEVLPVFCHLLLRQPAFHEGRYFGRLGGALVRRVVADVDALEPFQKLNEVLPFLLLLLLRRRHEGVPLPPPYHEPLRFLRPKCPLQCFFGAQLLLFERFLRCFLGSFQLVGLLRTSYGSRRICFS